MDTVRHTRMPMVRVQVPCLENFETERRRVFVKAKAVQAGELVGIVPIQVQRYVPTVHLQLLEVLRLLPEWSVHGCSGAGGVRLARKGSGAGGKSFRKR